MMILVLELLFMSYEIVFRYHCKSELSSQELKEIDRYLYLFLKEREGIDMLDHGADLRSDLYFLLNSDSNE